MQTAIALLTTALKLQAATQVQLLPAGEFTGRYGRPGNGLTWKLPDDMGRALAARLTALHSAVRFNFDYEHQAMHAEKNGHPAPAAGWATKFEWRDGEGLFAANVQWTDRARRMIESGEYGYLSPVISYNKLTGQVSGVLNAAITNIPELAMRPIAQEHVAQLGARFASLDADGALSADELAICATMGVDAADFLACRNGDQARAISEARLTPVELATCRATGIDVNDFIATRDSQGAR